MGHRLNLKDILAEIVGAERADELCRRGRPSKLRCIGCDAKAKPLDYICGVCSMLKVDSERQFWQKVADYAYEVQDRIRRAIPCPFGCGRTVDPHRERRCADCYKPCADCAIRRTTQDTIYPVTVNYSNEPVCGECFSERQMQEQLDLASERRLDGVFSSDGQAGRLFSQK